MKKTLIATAIAGAMSFTAVAQAAEVNYDLYGSLRVKAVSEKNNSLDIADNSSRIGIKASTQLVGGITGIARFEQAVSTEDGGWASGRLAYIGATGDFGTVTAGRQWTPHYLWTQSKVDILDVGSNPTNLIGRAGNTAAYISPDLNGLQLAGVIIAGGDAATVDADKEDDDVDAYNLAAHYTVGDFSVGVSTVQFNNKSDKSYTTVAASYQSGPAYVAVDFSSEGSAEKNVADIDTFEIVGSYTMGDVTLLANYADFDKNGHQIAAEAQYKLGAKSRVAATVVSADTDAEKANKATDTLAISWRVDF